MRIRLPAESVRELSAALKRAGTNEIGGQLFGEQLAPSDFRTLEITFQKRPGTFARFIVDLVQSARDALKFFDRTKHRYTRFNYIGEWHSHPSFEIQPSVTDLNTMKAMVCDREFRGTFAVLMIVRLDMTGLTCKGWLFAPNGTATSIELELEE